MTIHSSADEHANAGFGIIPPGEGAECCSARDAGAGCIVAGDPAGRRIVLVHASSTDARAWNRLLRAVPAGQEWVSVARHDPGPAIAGFIGDSAAAARLVLGGDPTAQAAALRPLLTLRRARKPILVGCGTGVPVALRAALDVPDLVGGLLLIDPAVAEAARSGVLRRIAARLLPSTIRSTAAELQSMAPLLASIRVPVTLVQGKDEPPGLLGTPFLEQSLSGCRNLTVVTVPGAHVQPAKHESAVRTALSALVAAVERGGA